MNIKEMGLLNDTKSPKKLSTLIKAYYLKVIVISFIVGVVWFLALPSEYVNNRTYFSENALLPGLVAREFNPGSSMNRLLSILNEETQNRASLPSAWIQAQFRRIGLDVYTHNFTLHYPFGSRPKFEGTNVYAILRAPKASSTEALILSTPFRGPDSIYESTLPSIVLMIELAHYFRQYSYWSKDIIFLIAEHENLGFQSWLNAYHNVDMSDFLHSGFLGGRSGPIQGVINLEISKEKFSTMDIKIEGLNGQLPNLDLFNLAVELCTREMVTPTFHSQMTEYQPFSSEAYLQNLKTMFSMVAVQSTGLPRGAHGLFHRFGVQAITLSSEPGTSKNSPNVMLIHAGRVLEGIFRSLNNLLEKFHQSFFFYLLPSTRHYVSIGLYMPPFALIALPVLIRALFLHVSTKFVIMKKEDLLKRDDVTMWSALDIIILSHLLGILVYSCVDGLDLFHKFLTFSSEDSLYSLHVILLTVCITLTLVYSRQQILSEREFSIKLCAVLLELGTFLYTLALINISMAIVLSIIYVPVSICITYKAKFRFIRSCLLLLLHPFVLVYLCILVQSFYTLSTDALHEHLLQSFFGHKKVLLYTVEDMHFFGNWNYKIITLALLPLWLEMWILSTVKCSE